MSSEKFKELLQPIAEGLFGKQGAGGYRYKRPEFDIRPMEVMLSDLMKIDDVSWCEYAFAREPLNGKFTPETRREYAAKAIACGEEYAKKIIKEYGTNDPNVIAKAMNMEVHYPDFPDKGERVMFAEFRVPNQINIFMDAVKKAKKLLAKPEVSVLFKRQLDVASLLLSHELFHFVEEKYKKEIFTRTEKIVLWKLGSYVHNSEVMIFGEMAAMSFAKNLIDIPYSPYLMDVFLLHGYSEMEACGLYEEMMLKAGLEPTKGLTPKEIQEQSAKNAVQQIENNVEQE